MPSDNHLASPPPISIYNLYEPVLSFQKRYSRWPNDKAELEKFVTENKTAVSLEPYQKILFKSQPDGTVRIDYVFKSLGGTIQRTFVLSK